MIILILILYTYYDVLFQRIFEYNLNCYKILVQFYLLNHKLLKYSSILGINLSIIPFSTNVPSFELLSCYYSPGMCAVTGMHLLRFSSVMTLVQPAGRQCTGGWARIGHKTLGHKGTSVTQIAAPMNKHITIRQIELRAPVRSHFAFPLK